MYDKTKMEWNGKSITYHENAPQIRHTTDENCNPSDQVESGEEGGWSVGFCLKSTPACRQGSGRPWRGDSGISLGCSAQARRADIKASGFQKLGTWLIRHKRRINGLVMRREMCRTSRKCFH